MRHALYLLDHEPGLAARMRMAAARNCRTTLSSAMLLDEAEAVFLLHLFLTPRSSDEGRETIAMGVDVIPQRLHVDVCDLDTCRGVVDATITELLSETDPLAAEAPPDGVYLGGGLLLHRVPHTAAQVSASGGDETTVMGSSALLHFVDCSSVTVLVNQHGELVQVTEGVPGTLSGEDEGADQDVHEDTGNSDGMTALRLPALFSSDALHRLVRGLMGEP